MTEFPGTTQDREELQITPPLEAASSRHGSYAAGRTKSYQKHESAFVLYIFALHVIVVIKISF